MYVLSEGTGEYGTSTAGSEDAADDQPNLFKIIAIAVVKPNGKLGDIIHADIHPWKPDSTVRTGRQRSKQHHRSWTKAVILQLWY